MPSSVRWFTSPAGSHSTEVTATVPGAMYSRGDAWSSCSLKRPRGRVPAKFFLANVESWACSQAADKGPGMQETGPG